MSSIKINYTGHSYHVYEVDSCLVTVYKDTYDLWHAYLIPRMQSTIKIGSVIFSSEREERSIFAFDSMEKARLAAYSVARRMSI